MVEEHGELSLQRHVRREGSLVIVRATAHVDVIGVTTSEQCTAIGSHEMHLTSIDRRPIRHVDGEPSRLVVGKGGRERSNLTAVVDMAMCLAQRGHSAEHLERDRQVVWGERPRSVSVAVGIGVTDTGGMHPDDAPQFAGAGELGKEQHPIVVAPLVHHEQPVAELFDQAPCLVGVAAHRLLDEDRDTTFGNRFDTGGVMCSTDGEHETIAVREVPDLRVHSTRAAMAGDLSALRARRPHVHLGAERYKVAQDQAPPWPTTEQSDR